MKVPVGTLVLGCDLPRRDLAEVLGKVSYALAQAGLELSAQEGQRNVFTIVREEPART